MSLGSTLNNPKDVVQGANDEMDANNKLVQMGQELDKLGKIKPDGTVDVQTTQIDSIIHKYIKSNNTQQVIKSLKDNSTLGFAMTRGTDTMGAIPWSIFQQNVDKKTLEAIGIHSGDNPAMVKKQISTRFHNAPAFIQDETKIKSLQHGISNPTVHKIGAEVTATSKAAAALDLKEIEDKLKCLGNGTWGAHWWGWTLRINTECGHNVANVIKAAAGAAIGSAIGIVTAALGGAALAIIPLLIFVALAGYLTALASTIEWFLSHGSNGVNINGLWIPGIVWISRV